MMDCLSPASVLAKARDKYANNPSHAPWGEYSSQCPVVCLDRSGDDGTCIQLLASAAELVSDGPELFGGWRKAVIKWNAAESTETVLAAFDKAIEEAKHSVWS